MSVFVYVLAALSGASALVDAVAWTRGFEDVFGNATPVVLLVVAVLLLGLATGGFFGGLWADHRDLSLSRSSLALSGFARVQIVTAVWGLVVSLLLPHLGFLSSWLSFYSRGANGWYGISLFSSLLRGAVALAVFGPPALLVGVAFTLLARHLVRRSLKADTPRIALLFGVNAIGAALGVALAGLWLTRTLGFLTGELLAAALFLASGLLARQLASVPRPAGTTPSPALDETTGQVMGPEVPSPGADRRRTRGGSGERAQGHHGKHTRTETVRVPRTLPTPGPYALSLTGGALALCAFAFAGLELLWARHFTLLLGGFQAIFTVLLAITACGLGFGAILANLLLRWIARPAEWLMAALSIFVVLVLVGVANADIADIMTATGVLAPPPTGILATPNLFSELWLSVRPMLFEAGLPSLLMGFAYPLANAVVQVSEEEVGYRAGALYAWMMVGAVVGLVTAGSVLLPTLGLQQSATALTIVAALAAIPLDLATRTRGTRRVRSATLTAIASLLVSTVGIALWWLTPPQYVLARATASQNAGETLVTLREDTSQLVAVTEVPGKGRFLITDDYSVSADNQLVQRSKQSLAHIPLTAMEKPEAVLMIGFGVGNSAEAAALHSSVKRIEIADPSAPVLAAAAYFKGVNKDVLSDPRVAVYVNDGRQHLRMRPADSYDLIAVDGPLFTLAGAASLNSKEFYALARTRLKPGGYISLWLPVYLVPPATLLSMIRAFVDVFPQSVLLGGTDQELILLGTKDTHIEIDPNRVITSLAENPTLVAELKELDLDSVRSIVGTFVASSQTLERATENVAPVTDNRPGTAYVARSRLTAVYPTGLSAALVDLKQIASWCVRCFADGKPIPAVQGIDTTLPMLEALYTWSLPPENGPGSASDPATAELIQGSPYLRAIIGAHAARRNAQGVALASSGKLDEAMVQFRGILRLDPGSSTANWNLGRTLASKAQSREALVYFRRAVELDPKDGPAHYDLASTLLDLDQVDGAIDEFRAALLLMPNAAEVHNNLGLALLRKGRLENAINEFQQALKLNPENGEARHNLDSALQAARAGAPAR